MTVENNPERKAASPLSVWIVSSDIFWKVWAEPLRDELVQISLKQNGSRETKTDIRDKKCLLAKAEADQNPDIIIIEKACIHDWKTLLASARQLYPLAKRIVDLGKYIDGEVARKALNTLHGLPLAHDIIADCNRAEKIAELLQTSSD